MIWTKIYGDSSAIHSKCPCTLRCMGYDSCIWTSYLIIEAVLAKHPGWIITRWPVFQLLWTPRVCVCIPGTQATCIYDINDKCKSTRGILLSFPPPPPFLFPFLSRAWQGGMVKPLDFVHLASVDMSVPGTANSGGPSQSSAAPAASIESVGCLNVSERES